LSTPASLSTHTRAGTSAATAAVDIADNVFAGAADREPSLVCRVVNGRHSRPDVRGDSADETLSHLEEIRRLRKGCEVLWVAVSYQSDNFFAPLASELAEAGIVAFDSRAWSRNPLLDTRAVIAGFHCSTRPRIRRGIEWHININHIERGRSGKRYSSGSRVSAKDNLGL
jgi:hypothetical protein